ncbi:superfamily I DNA/RNA helicase [Acetoanaerobium pronyense]|uniref:Superfamily I DNA/RNA helicase n=1 Tax=Acetoanaerobium pronyense TaxID=1482736 RepID=A0ABS4KKU1_9FIRM|nr:3'-5' exonuclease [Acetoanaerobium pronyense]MBP2027846.1 superfamily I DNA/RNA helicase [Acetoanaerobium pronyense]
MKFYSNNILSEVEAFKTKDSEREFYKYFKNKLPGVGILKITPYPSFYADLYYEYKGKTLIIKFMDTQEDTFSILEEELMEIMEEESLYLRENIDKEGLNFNFKYVFFMPYVDLSKYSYDFAKSNIIDKSIFERILNNEESMDSYMSEPNDEITLNLMRYYLCKEYHVMKKEDSNRLINKEFKKLLFSYKDHNYQAMPLTKTQVAKINSIKYGNTLFIGPAGSGKTTTLLARAIKLSKVYNKDKFLFITFNKQLMNDIKNNLDMTNSKNENLEIINFHSYILGLSKKYGLKIEKNSKKNFDQQFDTIFTKVSQIYKDKNLYKGIFIDEAENFKEEHFLFLENVLYKTKKFLMISADKGKDIRGTLMDFVGGWENFDFRDIKEFNKNYRSTKSLTGFTNNFIDNVISYSQEKNLIVPDDYLIKSASQRIKGDSVCIEKVETIEEKFQEIINKINFLQEKKKINISDICIIFPFNKRKTGTRSVIYFQYLLKKALDDADIPYISAHEEITNLNYKSGVTISNIYSINNLEYKAVILCELEMLFNHSLGNEYTMSDSHSFIKNINVVYTAITRATDYLQIFTLMDKEDSDIIKMLWESVV